MQQTEYTSIEDGSLTIAGKTYRSRLLVGTGKYRDLEETRLATEASGAEIVTVAIRRVNIGQNPNEPSLLDVLPTSRYTMLPNSAGCYNATDAMQLRDTGVPAETIPPVGWEIKAGKLDGGYWPVKYSRENSDIQGHLASKNPIFDKNYVSATTPHGYTIARTEYKGALDLNGTYTASSLHSMIHDIAFREAIRNANKLISNQELRTAIQQYWGNEAAELLPGWLKDIANAHTIDDNYATGFTKGAAIVRQNVMTTLIAFNPGTYIKHGFTAALMSANQVGTKNLLSSVKDIGIAGNLRAAKDLISRQAPTEDEAFMQAFRTALDQGERGEGARQFMLASSAVMRQRSRKWDDSISGAVDMMNRVGLRKLVSDTRQNAMLLGRMAIAYSDMLSAGATWDAAYKTAYTSGESHPDSVFIADRAVSRTHGSAFIGDQPAITRLPNTALGELGRWFVPFYRFWNHMFNMELQFAWDTASIVRGPQQGPNGENFAQEPGANAKALSGKLAVFLGALFIEEQASAPLDESKHGFLTRLSLAGIRFLGGGVVGLREATNALAGGYEPSVGMLGTVMRAGAATAKDIFKSTSPGAQVSKDWLIHSATALGVLTGVGGTQPGKTLSFMKDMASGKERPQTFNEYRQGLRTGHSKARKF